MLTSAKRGVLVVCVLSDKFQVSSIILRYRILRFIVLDRGAKQTPRKPTLIRDKLYRLIKVDVIIK